MNRKKCSVITIVFHLAICAWSTFDFSSRINVVTYHGQGPNQPGLLYFCQKPSIDIIPLAFVDIFPAQGNGFPGSNFGNRCWGGTYSAPGYNGSFNQALDALQAQCPTLVQDIPICQSTYRKKILLSLGGATNTYQLQGVTDGRNFADFLWGAFGPQTPTWLAQNLPRPFDGPGGQAVEVDGFDFDIEISSNDNSAGYIALISRLRSHFQSSSKKYLITGAPQCLVPDANMGAMISAVPYDVLWVQYHNTPACSARAWTNTGGRFSYDAWTKYLSGTASADAKLYIGLPGSTSAVANPTFYLHPAEALRLIKAFSCRPNFGGVMLWDATYADLNVNAGLSYHLLIKDYLLVSRKQSFALGCAPRNPAQPHALLAKT